MPRKYKNPKKPNIVSMRITDDEMVSIQQIMELTEKRPADLMRDAFMMFKAHWEMSRAGGALAES